jgi:hypothetical protein
MINTAMIRYILKDRTPIPCVDLLEWAAWFATNKDHMRVARDVIEGVEVSTVFLGLDHQWRIGDKPLLFETMIFGGVHHSFQARASTWIDAETVHASVVDALRRGIDPHDVA